MNKFHPGESYWRRKMNANSQLPKYFEAISIFTVLLSLLFIAEPAVTHEREVEREEICKWFSKISDRSFRLDVEGDPHIVFGKDWLYYACHHGSCCQIEIVDCNGYLSSVALDAAKSPRISYYDDRKRELRFAYPNGSGWDIEIVDNSGNVGKFPSLALSADGTPHICYFDVTNRDLKYAYRDEFGWNVDTIDIAVSIDWYPVLSIDESGFAHVSYTGFNDRPCIKHAYQDTSGWNVEILGILDEIDVNSPVLALDTK